MQDYSYFEILTRDKSQIGWPKLLAAILICILPVAILWGGYRVNNNQLFEFPRINDDEFLDLRRSMGGHSSNPLKVAAQNRESGKCLAKVPTKK
jgi:hypothetical protein